MLLEVISKYVVFLNKSTLSKTQHRKKVQLFLCLTNFHPQSELIHIRFVELEEALLLNLNSKFKLSMKAFQKNCKNLPVSPVWSNPLFLEVAITWQ